MQRTHRLGNVFDPAFMRQVKRTLRAYQGSMEHSPRKGVSREAFVDVDEKGAAWFLGHMQSAFTALAEKTKDVDFVLEIRDARLPFTTENPNIRKLTMDKPRLIIFNKAELSNEDCNRAIQEYYESTGAFALFTSAKRSWRDIVESVQRFATHVLPAQRFRTAAHIGLVVGMPNVGKSTLINALRLAHEYQFHREDFRRSRTPETVSITPGTTRAMKLVPVCRDPNVVLYDTPGLTLPGCFARESGLKLAACGIVPTNDVSLPNGVVARYVYDVLVASGSAEHMAECLHLPRAPISFDDCIAMICERSGTSGQTELGNLDPVRAQRFLVHDFQLGNLGKITLDPLPRRFRQAASSSSASASHLLSDGVERDSVGADEAEGFVHTHHVESVDVVDRHPDHMREVLETLRGPIHDQHSTRAKYRAGSESATRDTVISRKKGPISTVSAYDDDFKRNTRLMRGR